MPIASPDLSAVPVSAQEAKVAVRLVAGLDKDKATEGLFAAGSVEEEATKAFAESVHLGRGREGLTILATGFKHETTWEQTAKNQIQTDFDAAGNRIARTGEAVRLNDVRTRTKLYEKYLKLGFDSLTSIPGGEQVQLMDLVKNTISSNPLLQEALQSGGVIPTDTLKALLRDRLIMNKLAGALNETYDSANIQKSADLENSMIEARKKLNEADTALTQMTTEQGSLNTNKGTLDGQKSDFETNAYLSTSGVTGGKKEEVYQNLSSTSEVASYLDKRRIADDVEKRFNSGSVTYPQLVAAQTALDTARANPKASEYISLSQERARINGDLKTVTDRLVEVDKNIAAKTTEKAQAQVNVNNITTQREAISKQFKDDLEKALPKALQEHLSTEALKMISGYRGVQQEAMTGIAAKYGPDINKHLDSRWQESYKTTFGKERIRINKELAKKDFATIMDPSKGIDKLIDGVLVKVGVPPEQIALLKQDRGFMATQRTEITAKTLIAYTGSGENLNEKSIKVLASTSWGEAAFQGIIDNNAKVKDTLKKLKDSGITDGSFGDIYRKFGKKGILSILLGTLLSPAILVAEGAQWVGRR